MPSRPSNEFVAETIIGDMTVVIRFRLTPVGTSTVVIVRKTLPFLSDVVSTCPLCRVHVASHDSGHSLDNVVNSNSHPHYMIFFLNAMVQQKSQ